MDRSCALFSLVRWGTAKVRNRRIQIKRGKKIRWNKTERFWKRWTKCAANHRQSERPHAPRSVNRRGRMSHTKVRHPSIQDHNSESLYMCVSVRVQKNHRDEHKVCVLETATKDQHQHNTSRNRRKQQEKDSERRRSSSE